MFIGLLEKMAATLKDIAEFAGVSVSTASIVVRRDPKLSVSESTQKRVLEAVRKLNYHPNIHARVLSGGRSKLIGMTILDDYGELTYSKLRMIQRMISECGYESLLRDAGSNGVEHAACIQDFLRSRVQGMIAVQGCRGVTEEDINKLKKSKIPVITLVHENNDYINSVTVNHTMGAYLAVKHLIELGHKKIGTLLSRITISSITERVLGCTQAFVEAGIEQEPGLWMELPLEMSPETFASGYKYTKVLLQRNPDVTALFCSNDEIAIGAMKAVHDLGLRVPQDVSIVGFDNLPVSEFLQVPLTSIAQPNDQQVRETVDLLLQNINEHAEFNKSMHKVLEPQLILRKSTAPPRDK